MNAKESHEKVKADTLALLEALRKEVESNDEDSAAIHWGHVVALKNVCKHLRQASEFLGSK